MSTWKKGRMMLNEILHAGSLPLDLFLDDVERRKPPRVPGTAVFMTSSAEGVPVVLLHHLKHNKVLHEQVVLMSILTQEVPEVPEDERVGVERLEQGFYRVTARYGFMENPNVPEVLTIAKAQGLSARAERHDVLSRPRANHHRRSRTSGQRVVAASGCAPRAGAGGRRAASDAPGALAQEALRRDVAQRPLGDGVLRHPAEPGRRARSAGRVLSGEWPCHPERSEGSALYGSGGILAARSLGNAEAAADSQKPLRKERQRPF